MVYMLKSVFGCWVKLARSEISVGALNMMMASMGRRGLLQQCRTLRSGARCSIVSAKRTIFTIPEMPHLNKEKGIPGLFTPKGLDTAWYKYQQHVLDNLNEVLRGFEGGDQLDSISLQDLILRSRADSNTGAEFANLEYYASLAYNNEFFFQRLLSSSTEPNRPIGSGDKAGPRAVDTSDFTLHQADAKPHSVAADNFGNGLSAGTRTRSDSLADRIMSSFGSHLALKEQMIDHADAIFGNGSTWLVASQGALGVVNTYNAGTPFSHITEHESRGTSSSPLSGSSENVDVDSLLKVTDIVPLLNLNVWEHVYMQDYGVSGKRAFLENLFYTINWDKVEASVPKRKLYGPRR